MMLGRRRNVRTFRSSVDHDNSLGMIVLGTACGLWCMGGPLICRVAAQTGFVHWETPHTTPLALTPSGNTLLAVNTADNRLEVYDVSGGTPVHVRSIAVGLDPVSVRARSETQTWVINHISDSISIVDLVSGRVTRTVGTGDEPRDIVFAGTPQRAFVSLSTGNQVRVWDPANITAPPAIINIQGADPRSMAVSADGSRVYVAIFQSQNATGAVRQQDVTNPTGPYGGLNPPPNSGNLFNPPIAAGLPPPPPVAQIVRRNAAGQWLDDNNRNWSAFVTWNVLDNDVAIIDAQTLSVTYAQSLMTNVMGIGVRPDGSVTAIGTEALNQIRFAPNVQSIFIRCLMGSFAPATPGTKTIADLNPHLTYAVRSVPQATRDLSIGDPRAIVWDSNGFGYVAGMGSNNVIVINGAGARLETIPVGEGPTGLVLNETTGRLYVMNKFAATISEIDLGTWGEVSRTGFYDPTPPEINAGRPLLYNTHLTSGLGQSSCASCHIDARADFLAWDLGDPQGVLKAVNQPCRQGPGNCRPWHPMKGPMVTQSLQGIIGVEPLHWRGDREDIAAFAPAFVELQGDDTQPSSDDMLKMSTFLASIDYPPSPNRNVDGTLPASLPTSGGGNGDPNSGRNLYLTLPVLPGGATCQSCHPLPTGAAPTIDDPRLPLAPQPLKTVQLRGMDKKVGWLRNSPTNLRGFGFNHHSEFDTLNALLNAGFAFAPGATGQQQRRDVEAFLLCLTNDTQAGVGQQVTFDGANNNNVQAMTRLNNFVNLANGNQAGLVAKGFVGGVERGWVYVGGGNMQSDRAASATTVTSLRLSAATGSEVTFTLVPIGTQVRIGVDRDADSYFDRDELDGCSDPADPASVPGQHLAFDFNCDARIDAADVGVMAACRSGANVAHDGSPECFRADTDGDNDVDGDDFGRLQRCYSGAEIPADLNCLN